MKKLYILISQNLDEVTFNLPFAVAKSYSPQDLLQKMLDNSCLWEVEESCFDLESGAFVKGEDGEYMSILEIEI